MRTQDNTPATQQASATMDVDDDGGGGVVVTPAQESGAERFAELKAAVKEVPGDYGAHLALVEYLRRERPGSLELLKARQDFSTRFPLSPELWQEWIDNRRAAGGDDGLDDVLDLYERAFSDYQCAKLWPGYLETLEESLDEDDEAGVSTMREAFERALSHVGVHPILGGAVWRLFLRFEQDELEDAEETGAGDGEVFKAKDRVKRLYRRFLSVPLVSSDEASLLEGAEEAFSGDSAGFKEACQAHAAASKMLAVRMEHEEAIGRCQANDPGGPGAANAWEAYAAMEAADGHPSRAVLVLERAESEGCCLHERIWIMHSDLLLSQMGAKDQEEKLTARAVRNLPWSAELWCRRLRSLERCPDISPDEGAAAMASKMRQTWKDALGSALPSPDEYVKVLLAYCSSFRRRLLLAVEAAVKHQNTAPKHAAPIDVPMAPGQPQENAEEESRAAAGVSAPLEAMRGAFDESEAFVDKNYPGWHEGWLSVVRQRIKIEDEIVEDIADLGLDGVEAESQARRQWERVLRHSGKCLASWVEAAKWERQVSGDLDACRRLYERGMKEVLDYPEAACTAFLNFEQEAGSLEDWDAANKEVFKSRAARGLLSKDLPLASRAWVGGAAARPLHLPTQRQQQSKNKKQRQQQQQQQQDDRENKRPTSSNNKRGPPGQGGERAQDRAGDSAKRARTTADTDRNGHGKNKSPASAASADEARRGTKERVPQEKAADAAAAAESGAGGGAAVEGLTVFVLNLPFSTRDAGLKEMFKACGEVTSTRVLSTPKGRSKGLGYVTFATEEALLKALALDGTDVEGRALSVQRSLPRGSRPAKKTNATPGAAAATPEISTAPPAAAEATPELATGDGEGTGTSSGHGKVTPAEGGTGNQEEEVADKKKKKKKKKTSEGDVVVFGGGAAGAGGGGIKWPVHPTTVFVRGLGMSATSKDLREAFLGAGTVVEARVVEDKKTHEPKGYGLVQFEEPEAVGKALALDGTSMCGGTAKVSRSRHPAVIAAPAPAPEASSGANGASGPAASAAPSVAGADSGNQRRANDWDCPNADCDNVCFSFRTSCNRCGTGKDGSKPPPKEFQQGGASAGQPVATTLHRPRLQLGAAIRPRALRGKPLTNGAGTAPAGAGKGASRDGESSGLSTRPPPASSKSNADFRAFLNKK
ncbi:unnamed protein product [Scytosiphon promiscuus]